MFGPDWSRQAGTGRVAALQRECAVCVIALRWEWFIRGGGRGRERVACCRGLSLEWLRGGSWWQETQGLQWDLSAEWSMLQTIYEGESSFSTTERRVGHQQFPNQSKMHNVNNSGDHTARRFFSFWGISVFILLFSPSLHSSIYLWISSYFSPISHRLCLSRTHILSLSLSPSLSLLLSRTLNSLRSAGLSFCVKKRTQSFSAQQRGRIRHFFLNQGICSCRGKCCCMICLCQWDRYL